MRFPQEIRQKTQQLLSVRAEKDRERRERENAHKKKLDDLEKLRRSVRKASQGYAKEVLRWLSQFLQSEDAKEFFDAIGRTQVVIFCDSFWQGFPTDTVYCYATLEVSKDGHVFYGERYKGMQAKMVTLGKMPLRTRDLTRNLHPVYLSRLAEHLRSGMVWNYLLERMPDKIY